MRRHLLRSVALCIFILLVSFVIYQYSLTPKRDADWVDYLVEQPTIQSVSSSTYLISPLRDWQYGLSDQILAKNWLATTILDSDKLVAVWFVLEPFGKFPVVGHTFLSFEFDDGQVYSFSIEARREWGESYSTLQGLFRQYEVAYTWSTERDAISRRVVKDGHAVRMYKLDITQEEAVAVLRGAILATNEVAQTPRFYNTLTTNCTNELARIINSVRADTLPYALAWNLPGLADTYLMDEGYIQVTSTTEQTKNDASLLPLQLVLSKLATGTPEAFSKVLRAELAAQQTTQ